jgi:hypothetical protein
VTTCPCCDQPVAFVRNHHSRYDFVIDPEPAEDGTVVIGTGCFGSVEAAKSAAGAGRPRYRLHTCPDTEKRR